LLIKNIFKGEKYMESKAKLFGHAIHPVMIVFPLGFLTGAVVFDVIYFFTGNAEMELVAYWMLSAGIIGGFLAAPFGWIDWFAIPGETRAKSVGLLHGVGNMIVMLLFVGSWALRTYTSQEVAMILQYVLSFAGIALALVTGWLGGELVERLGVGVDNGANLNAPSSLSNETVNPNVSKPVANQ
jgi:uncharacterized membrane protein